jgi:hypothetical protein
MAPLERKGTTRFVILPRSSVKVSSWKVLRLLLISNRDNTQPVAPLALRRGQAPFLTCEFTLSASGFRLIIYLYSAK